MIDKPRLEAKCSTWNITLTGTQLDQLDAFAEILVDYNQKVNLTAITDPEGIEDKHFLDSLLFASQPEVAGRMVDFRNDIQCYYLIMLCQKHTIRKPNISCPGNRYFHSSPCSLI